MAPASFSIDQRAESQSQVVPPPPRLLVNGRVLLAELSRRGDVCRLARYRGHKLTEEWPVGPSLRSSAAPDRPRPGLPTPGRVCHSHNAVGKFACSDEFAVATGSLCRAPPPPGSCHHSGEDSRWCSWSTEQSDFDESLDGSEIPVFDPWAVESEAVIFLRRPGLIRPVPRSKDDLNRTSPVFNQCAISCNRSN